jgi:hypothetical protein
MCKGCRREARSEGSTKQMRESMDKNRIGANFPHEEVAIGKVDEEARAQCQ